MEYIDQALNYLDTYTAHMQTMFPYPDPKFGIEQWAIVAGYLAMVYFLPKIILKTPLKNGLSIGFIMALWNLFLSLFSLIVFVGVARDFSKLINEYGFVGAICDDQRQAIETESRPSFYWSYWFAVSKYAELVDTLLLILKHPDRPVPFLHWYHHATVLLFTWYSSYFHLTSGCIFIIMNAFIHTIMYGYYFFKELGITPPGALIITILQISQMIGGVVTNVLWAREYFSGKNCMCKNPEAIMISCAIMYGSYLYLFVQYFVKRYILGVGPAADADRKKKQKSSKAE